MPNSFKKFVQALTKNAVLKPFILLHGVRKLGSDILQFHAQPNIGILEIIFLLPDSRQHALASISLSIITCRIRLHGLRIHSEAICNIYC